MNTPSFYCRFLPGLGAHKSNSKMKYEDLMTMNIKIVVIWDVILFSMVARHKCFGGTILGFYTV